MPRYLLGPVSGSFNQDVLAPSADARFFGAAGEQDLAVDPDGSWDDLLTQLPDEWRPDFLVLWLPYASIPPKLWQAPAPIIGLAPDGNLLAHAYRRILPRCDLAFGSAANVERWRRDGISQARALNLSGLGPDQTASPVDAKQAERDIDVLFVGNLHPGVQRDRNIWLGRLAQLSTRFRVVIRSGVFGDEYRGLLKRSKIVFNRSSCGECNRRVFEAIAAGALLLQEGENAEVAELLKAGIEYAAYDEHDLEAVVERFLTNTEERQAVVQAAQARLPEFTFAAFWNQGLETIKQEWPTIQERMQARLAAPPKPDLQAALWMAVSGGSGSELAEALAQAPPSALALVAAGLSAADPEQAAMLFERALDFEPEHPVAGLNRAEALARLGKKDDAAAQARRSLLHLERCEDLTPDTLEAPHYPNGFDLFRVEWERAAWRHPGDRQAETQAKRTLLRSRLHSLLADLTGDLANYSEAALVRPDLATIRAALGCAFGRAGRFAEGLPHLRAATATDPFDSGAARACFQLLGDAGDFPGRAAFAHQRLALHRAAPEVIAAEDWFLHPPLSGRERASIIVLACNQADLTRLCLESVLHFTRGDYELILIDNGSTDGIPQLFEEIKTRSGPARVEAIRNEQNLGFAKGVNQGIAAAQGDFIVLLNNDTIVTPGWLDGLIHWSLRDWPTVGMVGPLSNYAPPPQHLDAGYQDLRDVEPFARQRRRQFAGRALEVPRLTGFCLLIRKVVLEAIGGTLDEQFGIGFFEDDDLCLRARQAGFRLLVAQDVFIHHFGNRTFKGLQLDTEQQLRDNFQRFRAKWGDAAAAPYRMADHSSSAHRPVAGAAQLTSAPVAASSGPAVASVPSANGVHAAGSRPTISLCMIVRNEEKNLAGCLGPLRDVVDEIVVVDTGSSDKTRQLAESLGARVFDLPWPDSFAAARNESIKHAVGEWIFWMDADDRIDAENLAKLKELFGRLPKENVAFVMKCLCVARAPGETATAVDHIRLFRNDPRIRWKYRVHEQILPAVKCSGGSSEWSDVVIRHVGYTDPALRGRKLERDLRLLKLEEQEQPNDPFTLFNLGSHFHEVNQPAEAIPYLRRSLENSHPQDSIVRKLYATIAQCERALDRIDAALQTTTEGRQHYPDDAELLFLDGTLLHARGERNAAVERYTRLLESHEGKHFASVDTGLRGYKARHNLAVVYLEQQRFSEAEAQLRAALIEEPAFMPSNLVLGDVLIRRKDWANVERHAEALSKMGMQGEIESQALLGRAKIERKEFAAARFSLKLASERYPHSLRLLQLLAQATTSEGADLRESEAVLRRILQLEPGDEVARRCLEGLRAKRAV